MDSLKALPFGEYNYNDSNNVRISWLQHRNYINKILSSKLVLYSTQKKEDLVAAGFESVKKYQLHPCLLDKDAHHTWYTFLIKCAMFEVLENRPEQNLSHFIFQLDKDCNRIPRGIAPDIYDRLDQFRCGIESGSIIRHFGTAAGAEAYAKEPKNRDRSLKNGLRRRSDFRASNKEFLRGLTYGFSYENENRTLVCPIDGSKIEGIMTYCENSKELVYSDCYEIHHAKYDQLGSFYKSTSPSSYLNKEDFVNFSQEVIEEFLGCIILSQSSHTRVHHTHKVDGIDNWILRVANGRCIFIPYHWRSKQSYNHTLAVLEEKCKEFRAADALSYEKFCERHLSARHRTVDELIQLKKKS